MWSQIRKAVAFGLYTSAFTFNLDEIKCIFSDLKQVTIRDLELTLKISMNTDATWQAKEGAILGIYSLVKLFQGGIHELNDSADDSVKISHFTHFSR